ncbi:hypothetical protein C8R45DRAFT_1038412 [Mycena sanguinolenta]|nr:hypothetical protein C8R45DRAFT_1038412 [Mycena sanguinolenta]
MDFSVSVARARARARRARATRACCWRWAAYGCSSAEVCAFAFLQLLLFSLFAIFLSFRACLRYFVFGLLPLPRASLFLLHRIALSLALLRCWMEPVLAIGILPLVLGLGRLRRRPRRLRAWSFFRPPATTESFVFDCLYPAGSNADADAFSLYRQIYGGRYLAVFPSTYKSTLASTSISLTFAFHPKRLLFRSRSSFQLQSRYGSVTIALHLAHQAAPFRHRHHSPRTSPGKSTISGARGAGPWPPEA